MKRRKFVVGVSQVVGGYLGAAALGSLPQLVRINSVALDIAQAQSGGLCICEANDLCICEANDACICEANDLVVCPADGHAEPCVPDVCNVQDGCGAGDVRICRVSDVCDIDNSGDCRIDSCGSDSSGACVGDSCTSDSSRGCVTDQCAADASGTCSGDDCVSDSSGSCFTDSCVADSSGDCRNDQCTSDRSGACLTDNCASDSSGYGANDDCRSDSSGACRDDQCSSDSSRPCIADSCTADSSGACLTDRCTADASGACRTDHCLSDSSGDCRSDRCSADSSGHCSASDVCVRDRSGDCDSDLCRDDVGGPCATRDVCATDATPAAGAQRTNHALRWLFRLSLLALAAIGLPDEAPAATVIDASNAVFSTAAVFEAGQPVGAVAAVGPFIRDCDGDGIDEADTNGDGQCAGDPELRDYDADGSRELPAGTPFAGSLRFSCFQVPSDVRLTSTGPVTIESSGDVGIHGAVEAVAAFTVLAQGRIDLTTSAWQVPAGVAPRFRSALAGEVVDSAVDYSSTALPALGFAGVCGAVAAAVATTIPALGAPALGLLGLALASLAIARLRRSRAGGRGPR